MPKRKHVDDDDETAAETYHRDYYSAHWDKSTSEYNELSSDNYQLQEVKTVEGQGEKAQGLNCLDSCHTAPPPKKRVRFDGVTLYYFHRSQGFTCVPSRGGTTLGMTRKHHKIQRLSLTEHEVELLKQREKQSPMETKNRLMESPEYGAPASAIESEKAESSWLSQEEEEEEEDVEDEEDEDEEEEEGELEEGEVPSADWESQESDDAFYLQPLGARERRALLRSSGVVVEGEERLECQLIRSSRQTCGCDCPGECRPESCACAKNQIKCQVDRPSFPCGCTKVGCGNPNGRVEFNPVRVRTHYVHTMMRMKMESRNGAFPSPSHIRFDGADSYCDSSSSTEEPSSPDHIFNNQPIPSFHTFVYPGPTSSNGHSEPAPSNQYLCSGQQQSNPSYWHLDTGSYAAPDPSLLSQYGNSYGYGMDGTPVYYGEQMNNGNLDNSVDSGFAENGSNVSDSGGNYETYSLSSLYQHQNQKPLPAPVLAAGAMIEDASSSRINSSGFQSSSSTSTVPEVQELATVLKKSICGAVVT